MLRNIPPHGLVEEEGDQKFWKPVKSRQSVVRLAGPVPFLDEEILPIRIAASWDRSCRHPLGPCRAYHAPVEMPFTESGGEFAAQSVDCEAGYFRQCADECLLCKGCVDEDWFFALPLR